MQANNCVNVNSLAANYCKPRAAVKSQCNEQWWKNHKVGTPNRQYYDIITINNIGIKHPKFPIESTTAGTSQQKAM